MKCLILLILPALASAQTLTLAKEHLPPTIEYAKVEPVRVSCEKYYTGTWYVEPFGPYEVVFWLLPFQDESYEYAQLVARWDGQRWVRELPCLYKFGGRLNPVIDWVRVPLPKIIKPEPRA